MIEITIGLLKKKQVFGANMVMLLEPFFFGLIKHFISFYICLFGKINEENPREVKVDEEDKGNINMVGIIQN